MGGEGKKKKEGEEDEEKKRNLGNGSGGLEGGEGRGDVGPSIAYYA